MQQQRDADGEGLEGPQPWVRRSHDRPHLPAEHQGKDSEPDDQRDEAGSLRSVHRRRCSTRRRAGSPPPAIAAPDEWPDSAAGTWSDLRTACGFSRWRPSGQRSQRGTTDGQRPDGVSECRSRRYRRPDRDCRQIVADASDQRCRTRQRLVARSATNSTSSGRSSMTASPPSDSTNRASHSSPLARIRTRSAPAGSGSSVISSIG